MPQPEIIFTTIHGSHLYGLNHPHSDLDTFTVTTSNRGARQVVAGNSDSVTIGWDAFIAYAFSGSHQSCEALFSPYKEWHSHKELRHYLEGMRVMGGDVLAKYRRTIKSFSFSDDMKKRRHAVRLWLNMQGLRVEGRFYPVMTDLEKTWASDLAADYGREELYEILCLGESTFA